MINYNKMKCCKLRSPQHASVPERMGLCYSEAAVSVTVTSITNILSFFAGAITPFPCVRIFCIYTGIAVMFIYVWQLTFFGACLAIAGKVDRTLLSSDFFSINHMLRKRNTQTYFFPFTGHREKKNKAFFNITATPKSLSLNRSLLFKLFLTGGINPADPYNPLDNKEHAGMVFLRDKLGSFLSLKWVKSLVLVIFSSYIVVAVWGITNIKEGLDLRNTVKYDSYSIEFYNTDDQYFNEYRYPINVIIKGDNVDYSDKNVQQKLETILQTFENSTFISSSMSSSWLRDFLNFVERNQGYYTDMDINIDGKRNFLQTLTNSYLSDRESPYNLDILLDESGENIVASRFLLLGLFINDSVKETEMVRELRHISDTFSNEQFQVKFVH